MMKGTYPVEIRFKDIDLAGHVHNSVYLSYFEQARMMLFAEFVADDWDWKEPCTHLAHWSWDYVYLLHDGSHESFEKYLKVPTEPTKIIGRRCCLIGCFVEIVCDVHFHVPHNKFSASSTLVRTRKAKRE